MTPILVSLGQISIYSGFISQTTYSTFLLGCLIGLTNYTYLQRRSKSFSLNLLILVIIPILVSKWHHTYLFFPLFPCMTIFILFLALLPLLFFLMLKYSREHSSSRDAESPQMILSICWWCSDSNMVKLLKFNLYKRKELVFLPPSLTSFSYQKAKSNLWFLFFFYCFLPPIHVQVLSILPRKYIPYLSTSLISTAT